MDSNLHTRMGSVNLVVIVESIRTLLTHKGGSTNDFHLPSILAVAAALGNSFHFARHAID